MPAATTTRDQRANSFLTSSPRRSGVPPAGAIPCFARSSRISLCLSSAFISVFALAMTACDVPAGANTPYHVSTSRSARPSSLSVGTWENACERAAGPFIRDMNKIDLRVELEQLHREVLRTPVSGGGVVKLARLAAREIEEFAHRPGRQPLRDDHRHRAGGEQYDRRKAPDRVERELLIDRGIGAEGGRRAKQRIAVGSSLGDEVGSYVARGARAVVRDDADLPAFAKFRSEDPREDVRARARRVGNDHLDRAARPGALLRAGAGGEQENRQCLRDMAQYPFTRWDHRRVDSHRLIMPKRRKFRLKPPRLRGPGLPFSRFVALTGA